MSSSADMFTQDELNSLIGKRVFDTIRDGRFVQFAPDMTIPYTNPGFKALTWDIVKNPNSFGSILRVGFVEGGRQNDSSAELKFVFLMEMK